MKYCQIPTYHVILRNLSLQRLLAILTKIITPNIKALSTSV